MQEQRLETNEFNLDEVLLPEGEMGTATFAEEDEEFNLDKVKKRPSKKPKAQDKEKEDEIEYNRTPSSIALTPEQFRIYHQYKGTPVREVEDELKVLEMDGEQPYIDGTPLKDVVWNAITNLPGNFLENLKQSVDITEIAPALWALGSSVAKGDFSMIQAIFDQYHQTYFNLGSPQGRALLAARIENNPAEFLTDIASVLFPAARIGTIGKLGQATKVGRGARKFLDDPSWKQRAIKYGLDPSEAFGDVASGVLQPGATLAKGKIQKWLDDREYKARIQAHLDELNNMAAEGADPTRSLTVSVEDYEQLSHMGFNATDIDNDVRERVRHRVLIDRLYGAKSEAAALGNVDLESEITKAIAERRLAFRLGEDFVVPGAVAKTMDGESFNFGQTMDAYVAKTQPFSSAIRKQYNEFFKGLDTTLTQMSDKFGSVTDATEMGRIVAEGMDKSIRDYTEKFSKSMDAFKVDMKTIKTLKAYPNTMDEINKILAENQGAVTRESSDIKTILNLKKRIQEDIDAGREISLAELDRERSAYGVIKRDEQRKVAGESTVPYNSALSLRLYQALTDDLYQLAEQAGPEVADTLKKLKAEYADFKVATQKAYMKRLIRKAENDDFVGIAKEMLSDNVLSETVAPVTFKYIGKEAKDAVRSYLVTDIIMRAKGNADEMTFSKFNGALDKRKNIIQALPSEDVAVLNDVKELLDASQQFIKSAGGSQTTFNLAAMFTHQGAVSFLGDALIRTASQPGVNFAGSLSEAGVAFGVGLAATLGIDTYKRVVDSPAARNLKLHGVTLPPLGTVSKVMKSVDAAGRFSGGWAWRSASREDIDLADRQPDTPETPEKQPRDYTSIR